MKRRAPKKTETLEVRLPPETKQAFMAACRANGVSASRVVRALIRRYLRSASRAPIDWKRELEMLFTGKSRKAKITGAALGATAAAVAAFSLAGPAQAAADPRLAALFDYMDRDHDRRVTAEEFFHPPAESPQPAGVELIVETRVTPDPEESREALFARLDTGGDGALGLDELEAATVARTIVTPGLAAADRDHDDAITEGELAAYLTARSATAGIVDPSAGMGLLARGIVAEHDQDGDGKLLLADLQG